MLGRPHNQPADDIDHRNQETRHRIAANEFGSTVHGAVEVRLPGDVFPALPRIFVTEQARIQIGVDRHLLARHGVEGEAGRDLGDAPGALGDHDKVNNHKNDEDDQAHGVVAADDELPEGFDHLSCGISPGMAFKQYHSGGGDIQGQAKKGGHQQHGGEDGEVQRAGAVDAGQHHHHGQGNVKGEQKVEDQRR